MTELSLDSIKCMAVLNLYKFKNCKIIYTRCVVTPRVWQSRRLNWNLLIMKNTGKQGLLCQI